MIFGVSPLTAAFPASGSRNPYFYTEERERHPVFPDLCKAERDCILSPVGRGDQTQQQNRDEEVSAMAIDPVCGMQVDEKKTPAQYEYKGKKYYFCAIGCKERFAKDPEKFLKKGKK
jgi:YHS domain-containing protein